MSRNFTLVSVATVLLLNACGHKSPTPTLDSWSKFEGDLVAWFDQHYGRANNMRFAPVGIAYPVGSVLRRGSQSVLSSKCEFRSELPKPLPGPTLPTITSERKIEAKLDAGSYATKLLGEGSKLSAGFNVGPSLVAKIADPTVVILAEDQTSSVLGDSTCLAAVMGQDVSVVRGYLDAKYSISSSTGVTGDANATVKSNELVKVTITSTDKFSVEDAKVSPKMVVLADARIDKEVVVAPVNFLQSRNPDQALCAEVPRLVFSSSTDKPISRVIPEGVTGNDFASCVEFKTYLDWCGTSPEATRACIEKWNLK